MQNTAQEMERTMPKQIKKYDSFTPSRYTIKVKLIGTVSLVIFAALSGMVFSASVFFWRDLGNYDTSK